MTFNLQHRAATRNVTLLDAGHHLPILMQLGSALFLFLSPLTPPSFFIALLSLIRNSWDLVLALSLPPATTSGLIVHLTTDDPENPVEDDVRPLDLIGY